MSERTRQLEFSTLQPLMHDEAHRRRKATKMLAVLAHFRGTRDVCGLRVLDLGCSTGFIANEFREAGATTFGFDIDRPGLATARARFQDKIGLICADGEDVPLRDGAVDIVIFNHIYEHVVDADKVVAEIARILAPDGLVYLGMANRWRVMEPHYDLPFLSWLPPRWADRYVRRFGKADAYHERFRSARKLRRMTAAFEVWDYTETILAEPHRFAADGMVPSPLARLPGRTWRLVRPITPTFIWIGSKANLEPRGPELRLPPRRLRRP
jgi:SAM-dependent methyltransferase